MHAERPFTPRTIEMPEGNKVTFEIPESWSLEAASAFAQAFTSHAPLERRPSEENTLPSWLWKHRALGKSTTAETSARQVFERVAGSAAYAGWKSGLLSGEDEARSFYDEALSLLTNRFIAFEPERLAGLGVDWAYGAEPAMAGSPASAQTFELESSLPAENKTGVFSVRNETIDSILGKSPSVIRSRWQKFLRGQKESRFLALRFADTSAEWSPVGADESAPRLMLDLFRFRREDGTVDVPALQRAVRHAVLLLEFHYESLTGATDPARPLAIGYGNLAALLLSLALPYDSSEARGTAAALSAIITAEAVIASARLAQQLGPCADYPSRREKSLRALRNHRRAAYGERNDYERLSILPAPLDIDDGADLVLVAAARYAWDDALELAQQHGLRHLQLTALFATPSLSAFLECSAQGIDPETHLVRQCSVSSDDDFDYRRVIHPAVPMALEKTGCDPSDIKALIDHAVGYGTLKAAPGINHDKLRKRGFDNQALARVESYLPRVNHIHTAFTTWILGEYYSRYILKVSERHLHDPSFDVLRHLGFTEADITAANAFCCGYGTVLGAAELPEKAEKIFAPGNTSAEARIRMAAAVQGFIMGDASLVLPMAVQTGAETRANLLLSGWRQGLKSMSLYFEGFTLPAQPGLRAAASRLHRKILRRVPAAAKPAQVPMMPPSSPSMAHASTTSQMTTPRTAKPKATTRAASLRRGSAKTGAGTGTKRV